MQRGALCLGLIVLLGCQRNAGPVGDYTIQVSEPSLKQPFTGKASFSADGKYELVEMRQKGKWTFAESRLTLTPTSLGGRTREELEARAERAKTPASRALQVRVLQQMFDSREFRQEGNAFVHEEGDTKVTIRPK